MRSALVHVIIAFPAYLLAAGQFSPHELATGAVFAIASALAAKALANLPSPRFGYAGGVFRAAFATLTSLPDATLRTAGAFARIIVSGESSPKTPVKDFEHGSAEDPAARTRRALALLLATLAPDRFVVRMEVEGTLLHLIAPTDHTTDTRWLI